MTNLPEQGAAEAQEPPRCPKCGYSWWDCRLHGDHHLCGEPEPPQPTKPVTNMGSEQVVRACAAGRGVPERPRSAPNEGGSIPPATRPVPDPEPTAASGETKGASHADVARANRRFEMGMAVPLAAPAPDDAAEDVEPLFDLANEMRDQRWPYTERHEKAEVAFRSAAEEIANLRRQLTEAQQQRDEAREKHDQLRDEGRHIAWREERQRSAIAEAEARRYRTALEEMDALHRRDDLHPGDLIWETRRILRRALSSTTEPTESEDS